MNLMRDSDYICVRSKKKRSRGKPWYVLISFNDGFHDITFIDQGSCMKKFNILFEIAKREGSDRYIIQGVYY
jgi:hypothetical protein